MIISYHSDFAKAVKWLSFSVESKQQFLKLWAHAVAIQARMNARGKHGGKSRWWHELARSLQERSVGPTDAEISSRQVGAVLQEYGGVVTPVTAKALTIPLSPKAKGKRASELSTPSQPLFRVGRTLARKSGRKGELEYLFVLASRAVIPADPWFPKDQVVQELGDFEARRLFQKEDRKWHSMT